MLDAGRDRRAARGRVIALSCLAFACGMVGAAYASVPLYRIFCEATGYGGTTQRAEGAPTAASEHSINVRFDSNVAPGLAWTFQPTERQIRVRLGEVRQTAYLVKNTSDHAITARAEYNVTPEFSGAFFNKIACFCFDDQTLQPGEERSMPVIFFVSPDAATSEDMRDLPTITLSYTFFPTARQPDRPVAEGMTAGPAAKTF
ncbi:cytochrome c oxidase assembly protein CtaG [Aureimonas endophytica]|uniref:Cytochrome c oxidase assembly protein CtaG n=1 Tax=Aureimonas endophytica TaxID=2027858 RepID=A0A917E845_9HYPH|nr:cytochrome c oxidase assembly protein [Aureimonas endophytica]GGE14365.1 cytochrome c oxidase assembly protein CtaG [Aureimonas endophytica]